MSERMPLMDNRLFLPEWLRAPLYLGHAAKYFAALESHKHANGNVELVISSIDNTLWDDVWRIELDTQDTAGNALVLLSLLAERGLNILSAESSVNTFSKNHTTTILASAAGYSGVYDGTQEERLKTPYPQLIELRGEIIAYLGDQIAFRNDGSPMLKVSHVRAYRRLADDLRSGARFVLNRSGELLDKGRARLTTKAREHLEKAVGLENLTYSPAVDTKDRLIRIIFYGDRAPRKHHVQVAIKSDSDELLQLVLQAVYEAGGNIVRNNIRPCPPHVARRMTQNVSARPLYLDEIQYKTVDVTFDFVGGKSDADAVGLIDTTLARVQSRNPTSLIIMQRSWDAAHDA